MTDLLRWLALVVGLALVGALAQAAESELARGASLLAPFKRDLQQALQRGLAEGPVQAVAACQLRAPEIANALSRDDIRVGRSSHRLRNPSNAPPDWARPILDAYVASPSGRAARAVRLPSNRVGYVEPILLQPLCLTCHGEVLAPDVASRINELYPEDRAVGFEVGDLRGVFWIEFPAADEDAR